MTGPAGQAGLADLANLAGLADLVASNGLAWCKLCIGSMHVLAHYRFLLLRESRRNDATAMPQASHGMALSGSLLLACARLRVLRVLHPPLRPLRPPSPARCHPRRGVLSPGCPSSNAGTTGCCTVGRLTWGSLAARAILTASSQSQKLECSVDQGTMFCWLLRLV